MASIFLKQVLCQNDKQNNTQIQNFFLLYTIPQIPDTFMNNACYD